MKRQANEKENILLLRFLAYLGSTTVRCSIHELVSNHLSYVICCSHALPAAHSHVILIIHFLLILFFQLWTDCECVPYWNIFVRPCSWGPQQPRCLISFCSTTAVSLIIFIAVVWLCICCLFMAQYAAKHELPSTLDGTFPEKQHYSLGKLWQFCVECESRYTSSHM